MSGQSRGFHGSLKVLATTGAIELPYELKEKLYSKTWVVYAKRPFATAKKVIEYLGWQTHKTAFFNYRILEVGEES